MLLLKARIYLKRKLSAMTKVALITGASRGIGAATAKLLASKGFAVAINYQHSQRQADEIVKAITAEGGQAVAMQANMADETEIIKLFAQLDQELGPISALVNNAGVNGNFAAIEDISQQDLEHVFRTNVFATFITCREAIKRMKTQHGGSIVNISSEAARFGGTKRTPYAASKAAINTLTIGLAREVAPHHIRVNAVSPGVIDTDIHQDSPQEQINHLLATLPMKRMGSTMEVANLIAWLVSDAASYMSGAIIPITGAR